MKMNVDLEEVNKFDAISAQWWDVNGPFKPLHQLNPFRLKFVQQQGGLLGHNVIDIGCGGGIFAEALHQAGAHVNGIDMSLAAIEVAKNHADKQALNINYQQITAEEYAQKMPASADIVTCMELIEHVPDPASLIAACATIAKPGAKIFISTLNRNIKSYLQAIVGAEYLLNLIPKGTHDYAKFIRPSELDAWAQAVNLNLEDLMGITYNPLTKKYSLTENVSVNYIAYFRKKS